MDVFVRGMRDTCMNKNIFKIKVLALNFHIYVHHFCMMTKVVD